MSQYKEQRIRLPQHRTETNHIAALVIGAEEREQVRELQELLEWAGPCDFSFY
jgi:hypothetical protein